MINMIGIFVGLILGNLFIFLFKKSTLKEFYERSFFQAVVFVAIYLIIFSGWFGTPYKLIQ